MSKLTTLSHKFVAVFAIRAVAAASACGGYTVKCSSATLTGSQATETA